MLFFSSLSNTFYSICKCAFVKMEAIIEEGIVVFFWFFFKEQSKNTLTKSEAWCCTSVIDGNEQ